MSLSLDRIKKLFAATFNRKDDPARRERSELASIMQDIRAAVEKVKKLEASAAELRSTIEAGELAEKALVALAASPAGPTGLTAFVAGESEGEIARGVDKTQRAVHAADVARRALPLVESEIAAACAEVARLDSAKEQKIVEIVRAHGDRLGQKALKAFQDYTACHDQLIGFARGAASARCGVNVLLTEDEVEVPRFNLPSMPCGDSYSVYMTHIPEPEAIAIAARAWSNFVAELRSDVQADVAAHLSLGSPGEVNPARTSGLTIHPLRQREDEKHVVTDARGRLISLYPEEDRTRRQVKLT